MNANPDLQQAFRINCPNVVSETFEGEVVIVNLESGCYFSLLGSATRIWQQLESGPSSIKTIEEVLAQSYICIDVNIANAVESLLSRLIKEELIVLEDPALAIPPMNLDQQAAGPRPFEPPTLEAFTDLQDILLLDPIHDVDEAGWPVAAPPADTTG